LLKESSGGYDTLWFCGIHRSLCAGKATEIQCCGKNFQPLSGNGKYISGTKLSVYGKISYGQI
jgi:hypothetical protein